MDQKPKIEDWKLSDASDGKFEPIVPYNVGDRVLCRGDEGELTGTIQTVHVHDQYMVSYDVLFDNGKTYRVPHFALQKL